tara:strand:- start:1000 stop:1614 length:615 start_codon:yes stop_codon:yes gene_type:complete
MTKRTKTELATQVTTLLPDNTAAEISPADIRSIFTDTSDSLVFWDSTAPTVAGVYATATVTFTGVPTSNETIIIIDSASTSKTYTAKPTESLTDGHFYNGGTAVQAVDSLQSCIEDAAGHNGTITVAQDGTGLILTLTQASTGTAGNTAITETLTNVTKADFTGGVTAAPSCVQGEVVFVTGTTSYLYVCVATNHWRRSELSSF